MFDVIKSSLRLVKINHKRGDILVGGQLYKSSVEVEVVGKYNEIVTVPYNWDFEYSLLLVDLDFDPEAQLRCISDIKSKIENNHYFLKRYCYNKAKKIHNHKKSMENYKKLKAELNVTVE